MTVQQNDINTLLLKIERFTFEISFMGCFKRRLLFINC